MTYPVINGEAINGAENGAPGLTGAPGVWLVTSGKAVVARKAVAASAAPLVLGAFVQTQGDSASVSPAGIRLPRAAAHSVKAGMGPAATSIAAIGRQALFVGDFAASSTSNAVLAHASAFPLLLGSAAPVAVLRPSGLRVMAIGLPKGGSVAVFVNSASPLVLGLPRANGGAGPIAGIDLVRSGLHGIGARRVALMAVGAHPLQCGSAGMLGASLRSRQHLPLKIGQPHIDRGSAC